MKHNKHAHFRNILIVFFTVLMALAMAFEASAEPPKKLIKDAATAFEKGDLDVALEKFNDAYQQDSSNSSLLYNIGRVYESKAEYATAIEYYKQFLATPGSDEDARNDAIERIDKCEIIIQKTGAGKKATASPKAPAAASNNAGGAKKGASKAAALPPGGCIDVNKASVTELTGLNGIGEKYAQSIVDEREANGPYKSVDDMQRAKNIGAGRIAKFRDQVCPIAGAPSNAAAPVEPQKGGKAKSDAASAPKKAPKASASSGVIDI